MKHLYISTACQHGLHEKCRLDCKYCQNPCICPAHTDKTAFCVGHEHAEIKSKPKSNGPLPSDVRRAHEFYLKGKAR